MKKTKISLIVATVSILVGGALFAATMAANGWDFYKLETRKLQTKEYTITEAFTDITILGETEDILLTPSQTEECKVVCREYQTQPHTVSVEKGVLTVAVQKEHPLKKVFGISFRSPKITLSLPQSFFGALSVTQSTGNVTLASGLHYQSVTVKATTGDVSCYAAVAEGLKISLSTGDVIWKNSTAKKAEISQNTGNVSMENIVCDEISLSSSTGDAKLKSVACKTLHAKATTGDLTLNGVIAQEKITAMRSTGDITLKACDAETLYFRTSTGDVKGSLLTGKTFAVQTDTGKKKLPQNVAGGRCEVITDTGDIILEILP